MPSSPPSPTESHSSAIDLLEAKDYKYATIGEPKPSRWRPWKWLIISAILVVALLSVATFGIKSMLSHRSTKIQPVSCGKTFEEAHAHGCVFDSLTLTWLRPECSLHGREGFMEAAGSKSWQYWQDKDGTLVELGGYESVAYLEPGAQYLATYEQFLDHCMWILLRVHHAFEYGERLDFRTISYEHSKDCLGLLLHEAKAGVGKNLTRLSTRAEAPEIGYGVC